MSSPADAIAAGLPPANKQILEFNTAPVIKRVSSPADRALNKEQAGAYQRGELNVGPRTSFEGEAAANAGFTPESAPPVIHQAPTYQAPLAQPAAPQNPAIPLPNGPELRPTDPPRFQERINSLWRQKSEAEERAEALERRLSELTQRIDSRFAPQSQVPFTNQYGSSPPSPPPSTFDSGMQAGPSAGYVSRDELRALLAEQAQAIMAQSALQQAHTVSRIEAERTYPDVFQNPELKAAAEEIWRRDGSLRTDPRGVEKAALMARGLAYGQHVPFSTGPQASPQMRKEALSAIGSTVPEGQAAPNDQVARYNAAFAHAVRTQDLSDFARARRIAQGLPE